MMIIECVYPDSFTLNKGGRTKYFKPGDQMQCTDQLGSHLVSTDKWKLIEGALQTKEEKAVIAEWKAKEEDSEAPKEEKPAPKPRAVKKKEKK